jgi:hypothetical protein
MPTRREFLQAGTAAAALPFLPLASALPTARAGSLPISICDIRYPDSIVFAHQSRRLGCVVTGITDDIVTVIDGGIRERWRQESVMIAGLTRFPAFHCFERLAEDCGRSVLYHADHIYHDNGIVEHKLTAPASLLGRLRDALAAGDHWACSIADCMSRIDRVDTRLEAIAVKTITANHSPAAGHLESWLIV